MSLRGNWYFSNDPLELHYRRDGFVRTPCGRENPGSTQIPRDQELDKIGIGHGVCVSCRETWEIDVEREVPIMGTVVHTASIFDSLRLQLPPSQPARAWLKKHNMRLRPKSADAVTIEYEERGKSRLLRAEKGSWLLVSPSGSVFNVSDDSFHALYRPALL